MRTFYLCISVLAVVSCGTAARTSFYGTNDNVTVLQDKMAVVCETGDEIISFSLKQMLSNFHTLYPVLAGRALEGYDGWLEMTENDRSYRSMMSEDGYRYWEKMSSDLVRRYAEDCESIVFSVPGLMVACIQQGQTLEKMVPRPDCAITGEGKYMDRYFRIDTDSDPSIVMKNQFKYIFRTVMKDRKYRALVAVDRFYLDEGGKMLCLIYVCTGNYEYGWSEGKVFQYCGVNRFSKFNPLENLPMSFEYFYKYCDGVSIGLIEDNTGLSY